MLAGFGGATKDKHINARMTTINLIGGNDCMSNNDGDLKVKGGATIKKNLCVGSVSVKGNSVVNGNLIVKGDAIICGDELIKGNITVDGNIIFPDVGKVKVTTTDTLEYLQDKLVAGNAITLTTLLGPNEQIKIDGLPTSTLLQNVVYVAKNGNDSGADGSINKPFLTVQAAMDYAWTVYVNPIGPQPVAPFTRPTVYVCAGTYDDGNLILPPQICVEGQGFNHSRITGNWSIDTRWSNYSPPNISGTLIPNDFRSSWINVGLFGVVNIDFDSVASNEGKLYAIDVRFGDNITISEKTTNPVSNSVTFSSCEFLADATFNGIPALLEHIVTKGGTMTFNQAVGTGVDNIVTSGGSIGNIIINSTNSMPPVYTCEFGHTVQLNSTLTLNGQYSVVNYNINALPLANLITYSSGATFSQLVPINHADGCWSFNGDTLTSTKYIGTNNNFDFPINTNATEVARFSTDARLFMGAPSALHGSNAGIQYSSLVSNRAQFRGNQYGANTGVPGITTFKSRGTSIGTLSPVIAGDIIYGATGIGVAPGNLIPLSFLSRAVVSSVGASWISTDYELSLVPLIGPTNGVRRVFGVSSEGMLRVRETVNSMAGLVALDASGQFVVLNTNIKTTSRFTLTVQDNVSGPTIPPSGFIYVSTRTAGTSFTITSTAGATDAGVIVYYQIWEQAT
jgi:hypothetical protein